MKKFLAVLLSVVMLFTLGIAAFAEGEEEKDPMENIGLQEGKITLSLDNTYLDPSTQYSIPLRIYGDYLDKVPADAETLYIGAAGINLQGDLSAKSYATLDAIRFSDAIAEDDRIEAVYDVDAMEGFFAFKIEKADFAKMLKTSEEGLIIGYVDITTTDAVPEDYESEFGTVGLFGTYDLGYMVDGAYGTAGYKDADGNFTAFDLTGGPEDDISYDTAHCFHSPKIPTWKERLKEWGKTQLLKFTGFFITILNVLEELINQMSL